MRRWPSLKANKGLHPLLGSLDELATLDLLDALNVSAASVHDTALLRLLAEEIDATLERIQIREEQKATKIREMRAKDPERAELEATRSGAFDESMEASRRKSDAGYGFSVTSDNPDDIYATTVRRHGFFASVDVERTERWIRAELDLQDAREREYLARTELEAFDAETERLCISTDNDAEAIALELAALQELKTVVHEARVVAMKKALGSEQD